MNKTTCPLSPPAPMELPFPVCAMLAESCAAYMDACRVAEYVFPLDSPHAGRTLILTAAPQTAERKDK